MATEDGQQQGAAPDITGSGTTFELPPDPPAGDEGEAGEPAEGAPAKPANRQQRRAERGESFAAATRAAEERARRAEEAAQRTAVELAELRGRVTAGESQRQQGAPDPDEAALIAAQKKISAAVARMGAGDATAEADWHAAMRDHARIVARQVAREEGAEVEKRISGKIPAPVDPGQAA